MVRGKHLSQSSDTSDLTRPGHTHKESRSPVILLAIAITGVLLITLQIVSGQAVRSHQRTEQIQELHRLIEENNHQNLMRTCQLLSTIPPDNGVVDAFRKQLKCGAYAPPAASTKTTGGKTTAPSGGSTSTSSVNASQPQSQGNLSGSTPRSVGSTTRPPGIQTAPSTSTPANTNPTTLGVHGCVLIVCL